ncbi:MULTISPECIES: DUF1223 domain-containing protein [unclassified Sphingomonas]|jgi:hypothetical protein|uniref:DUF1223 domain-containing protein n=1 Tax=unclassified Sphingomonas TaxID=196159 RepID=UPI00082B56E1|nr:MULTISPECIES: DUF1223 domain-containing protein [unclassified Sphingomonas]MCH4891598.1 DUF1223 domain-containing protein [Sphingomonas sp. SFZ2018-12]
MTHMKKIVGSLTLVAAGAIAWATQPAASTPPAPPAGNPAMPVAVELFTSQGCSSCPPADHVQAILAADPSVVAITRPVTYWDRLGWKDTLAREENTNLQRAYAGRKIPGAGVYTPQSVVQGRSGVVGGRGDKIKQMIIEASKQPQPAIAIQRAGNGPTQVTINGKPAREARVTLVALRRQVDVNIANGENGGRKIRYSNVFTGERELARWKGGEQRITIMPEQRAVRGADRYALVVREGTTGPILAARYL